MGWILYTHCLLALSIQWIFRNRILDLLCMPMHRIGSFHFSLTCSALLYRSKHLACFLHLLYWILVVFVHLIFIWHVPCTSCVGSYLYSYIGSSFGMFLAPPVLDLICIRTLDLRLLCFCSHFGYQHTCILDLGSFVLDLICILPLDLRVFCFCNHFGYQAKQPCC